jgi:hypothetical protein
MQRGVHATDAPSRVGHYRKLKSEIKIGDADMPSDASRRMHTRLKGAVAPIRYFEMDGVRYRPPRKRTGDALRHAVAISGAARTVAKRCLRDAIATKNHPSPKRAPPSSR